MSLATVCPHCHSIFRTPPSALQAAHGQVRCGGCGEVFISLKHAIVLDGPSLITKPSTNTLQLNVNAPRYNIWKSLLLVLSLCGVISISSLSWAMYKGDILSLEFAVTLHKIGQFLNIQTPPQMNIDALILSNTAMIKNTDGSIRVSFTIRNTEDIALKWPHITISLLANDHHTIYQQTKPLVALSTSKVTSEIRNLATSTFEFIIPAEHTANVVTYRLEIIKPI